MGAIWWDMEQKRSKLSKMMIKQVGWLHFLSLNQYDLSGENEGSKISGGMVVWEGGL